MATARRTATNESVSTYDSAGGKDYTSLTTWEQATDIVLTSGFEQVSISNVSATRFNVGETLSFSSSGATATCHGTNLARDKMYYIVLTGTPTTADTITGDTTGATADIDTIDSTNTGVSPILECFAGTHNDQVILSGATASGSFFRIVRPASGQFHDGTPNTGVIFSITSTSTAIFNINGDNFSQVQDLVGILAVNTSATRPCFSINRNSNKIIGCIAKATNAGSGGAYGFQILTATRSGQAMIDCIAYECKTTGYSLYKNSSTIVIYNCTAVDSVGIGFALSGTGGTIKLRNCLSKNTGADFNFSGTTTNYNINYCASADDTADDLNVDNNRINQTFTFVNEGTDDYHLASNDVGAKGHGVDMSSDGIFAFDDDIDRDTITNTFDIGADWAAAVGGADVRKHIIQSYMRMCA